MKKLVLLFALSLLIFNSCNKDDSGTPSETQPDKVILLTQQEVDDFGAMDYVNFDGDIWIGDDDSDTYHPNPSITNLNSLSSLKTVKRLYIVSNTNLTNLNGLSNLESVSIEFSLDNNTSLSNINALNNCLFEGSFAIKGNSALTNLNGIAQSTFNDIQLITINDNALLENINGITNLTSINGTNGFFGVLSINNNSSLIDIEGLSNLATVENLIEIKDNPLLTNFCGIQPLANSSSFSADYEVSGNAFNPTQQEIIDGFCFFKEFAGDITLWHQDDINNFGLNEYSQITGTLQLGNTSATNNPDVYDLTPLGSIYKVENFGIWRCNNLTNIDGLNINIITNSFGIAESGVENLNGLQNLKKVDGSNITIISNGNLSDFCGLTTLFTSSGFSGTYNVTGNSYNPTQQNIIDGNCSE